MQHDIPGPNLYLKQSTANSLVLVRRKSNGVVGAVSTGEPQDRHADPGGVRQRSGGD
jgi:hypothetical protein